MQANDNLGSSSNKLMFSLMKTNSVLENRG